MKKKVYLIPETTVIGVATAHLMDGSFTGGGTEADDPTIEPTPDTTDKINRSRYQYDCWEEEEEEDV
jgi:hypothetical protein